MKVVQFIPYFPPHTGGLENIAQNIAKNLVKYTDAQMLIITSDIGQKERGYHKYSENGYEVITVPAFNIVPHFPCFKFRSKGYREAMKELKKYNPDVIHTHTRFFLQTFHGGLWAKFHHKKWIHTEHGSGYVKGIGGIKEFIAWTYDQTLGRLVFGLADKIVSINKINLDFITKFTKKSKCEVIYNGIEDYKIEKVKNESGIVRLAYIGRLSPLKGVDILLKAIIGLKNQGINNFKLDIIGDGEEYDNLSSYIKENKLDNVELLGKKNHDEIINSILQNTDILINPSHQEGLPTTVLEGLISKSVVVATDVGGTSEISDKGDLILIKAGNVEGLRKGIEKALKDYEKLVGESYAELKEKFSWERNVKEYFRIYGEQKKIIVFIAPKGKGGTYYYYKDICDYLVENYKNQYNTIFCSGLKDYLQWHFKKADIIFSIIPFLFKPILAKKFIYNLHGNFKLERRSNNLGSKLLYLSELNLWFSDKILLTSYFIADKLGFRKRYEKKIEILPNYVKPVKKSLLKKENDNNFLTITSFSFYNKGKGVISLGNVIKKYGEIHSNSNITFSIAGNTNAKCFPKIKEEFDKIEFPKNVKIDWKGWLTKEKMEDVFYKNNTFVYRTELDNTPGVVLDSLNYGLRTFTNNFESFKYFLPEECICNSEEEMVRKIENTGYNTVLPRKFLFENIISIIIGFFNQ